MPTRTAREVRARSGPLGLRLAGGALALLVLAGCGSGPSAQDWAGQVCGALTPWRASIADLNTQAQRQISANSTPAQTQATLLALVRGGQDASETARAAVAAAGTPDVAGGEEVAGRFVTSLADTRDAYAHAHADLAALSTADAATFYDGVAAVLTTLTTEYHPKRGRHVRVGIRGAAGGIR